RGREHTDGPGVRLAHVARALERLPRRLEEDAMLWIHDGRVARAVAEEARVVLVDAVEHGPRLHVRRITDPVLRLSTREDLLVGERPPRRDAAPQVGPKRRQVPRARETPRHPDDGDARSLLLAVTLGAHGSVSGPSGASAWPRRAPALDPGSP